MSDIEQHLLEVTELISLPEVYLKVGRLLDDPASNIYDFAEVISVDPNLSTRVLELANSAYFGVPEPVDSITHAVNLIGLGQLHNMLLGVAAISGLDWNLSPELQALTRDQSEPILVEVYQVETALTDLAHVCGQNEVTECKFSADKIVDAEIRDWVGLTQNDLENSSHVARSISADMEKAILA